MSLITVFIPVYNTEKYIGKAIQSIIDQTYEDWELLIQDDCSTDNTYQIAYHYSTIDSRIKVVRNEKNLGMMGNWIQGVPLCKSTYWCKLDADDYWMPKMLERSIAILEENKNIGLVCSKYINIDENDKPYGEVTPIPEFAKNNFFSCIDLVKLGPSKMFQYNVLRQGIGLIRKSVFDDFGNFTTLDNGDTEMWFRIGCHYNIYCIDEILHYHRIWSESFMRKNADENIFRKNKNFFDARNAIFDYYYKHHKITTKEYKKFKNETKFIFNSFLIFKNRTNGEYKKMITYLLQNAFINPRKMLIENLHLDRIIKFKQC